MKPSLRKHQLTEAEQEAVDAVKFCLIKGVAPFRVDVQKLVAIIERCTVS